MNSRTLGSFFFVFFHEFIFLCLAQSNYSKTIRLLTKKRDIMAGYLAHMNPKKLKKYSNQHGLLGELIKEQHKLMRRDLEKELEAGKKARLP